MIIFGMIVFALCTWAVFSKRFGDGLIIKHFLIFSAITAMLVVVDPHNVGAAVTSTFFLLVGFGYWFFKHREQIRAHWHALKL